MPYVVRAYSESPCFPEKMLKGFNGMLSCFVDTFNDKHSTLTLMTNSLHFLLLVHNKNQPVVCKYISNA